ncbi:MAG TPA: ATP-binding protein, partial [Longimicrobiaceae bacterium]|nr:ATP-binding protein [Longimicrobiaceae bacterium]
ASVGTLLSGVAHELNNPLHAIRNFAQLLLLDPRADDDREALEIMRREADRAAKIVADLRFVGRQTQEATVETEAVDLNDIVRHVLKMRRYAIETRGVEVREDLAADLPPVRANRSEIDQVALNLVLNAEQALVDDGPVRRLILRTAPTANGAILEVADTGPGIEPEHLDRIFDPFWTTKSPGQGTGLGLSLVHSIIAEHGGTIRVESEPGKGACFTVELPAPGDSLVAVEAESPGERSKALRILVVDDEASIRESLGRYLRRRGHTVDEAVDGLDALRHLEGDGPEYDIILSDLRMPGMSGQKLFDRLRESGRGWDRRVVLMTGDAASEDARAILEATEAPVVMKPADLDEVARVIEEHARWAQQHSDE